MNGKIIFLTLFILFIILFTIYYRNIFETYGTFKSQYQLKKIYNTFIPVFNEYNIFIFYGTLLGYIRENNFIKNDDDIDVLISFEKKEEVLKKIKEKKFHIHMEREYFIQIYKNDIGPFDIYFYTEDANYIYIPWMKSKYEKDIIFPLKEVNFNNEKIYIPNNPIQFFELYYGNDWKIPQQKKRD